MIGSKLKHYINEGISQCYIDYSLGIKEDIDNNAKTVYTKWDLLDAKLEILEEVKKICEERGRY